MRTIITPPLLKWLINNKASLLGELVKLESRIPQSVKQSAIDIIKAQENLKLMETRHGFN
jgi:hypothetical protein